MTVQIRTAQIADAQITAAKIAALDAVIGYTTTHTLSSDTDIVHKKYVDDIAAYGVTWKEPVAAIKLKSDATQAGSPPTAGSTGETWVVDTWGGGYNDGDIVEWDGAQWNIVVANSGGEPPDGTRMLVIGTGAAGSFSGQENKYATYSSSAWSFVAPSDGDAVLSIADASVNANKGWVYDTGNTTWVQFAGSALYTAGDGILIQSNAISVAAYDGITVDSNGVSVNAWDGGGIGVDANGGVYNNKRYVVRSRQVYDAIATEPTPVDGMTYLCTGAGTWGGVAVAVGDLVLYTTANGYQIQVTNSGGYVPADTWVCVSDSAIDEFSSYQGSIMVATGTSNDPATWFEHVAAQGDILEVNATYGRGLEFVYLGSWTPYPRLATTTSSGLQTSESINGLAVLPKPNYGIAVDAQGVYVDKGDGLTITANKLAVKAGTGITVDTNGVSVSDAHSWPYAVHVANFITDAAQAGSPPGSPVTGGTYIVNTWGGGYTDGDVYTYAGGGWVKLYDTGGSGNPPTNLRGTVSTVGAGSFSGHASDIAEWDGSQWNFTVAADRAVMTVASRLGSFTPTNEYFGDGGTLMYSESGDDWQALIMKWTEQSETSWPAATTTWDLNDVPAQIDKDNVLPGALAVYYNGQRLLKTAGSGGGQGTYYMADADTITFDFTPVTGSTMEAVIGRWQ